MMNKQKTSKAWRWKVATFLPLLALLLMAFGNRSEKVPPEESIFAPISSEVSQDSIKVWTESDFKVLTPKNKEEAFFKNHVLVNFQIDANSKITVDGDSISLAEVSSYVKKWFNYKYAEQREWIHFQKITVNGKTQMLPMTVVTVRKDPAANQIDFLKLLNIVANTVLQIRGDYSQDIYGNLYQKITPAQRKEIDKLIPMKVAVTHAVLKSFMIVPPPPRPTFFIEIRSDGNYIDNKLCSLEEITKKAEDWKKFNSKNIALIHIIEPLSDGDSKINLIKESLQKANFVAEVVYFIVEIMPEFPGGQKALRQWVSDHVQYPEEAKTKGVERKVYVNFIVNSEGEIIHPKILRWTNSIFDAEALKVISQMPIWTPGKQKGKPVNVSFTVPVYFSLK